MSPRTLTALARALLGDPRTERAMVLADALADAGDLRASRPARSVAWGCGPLALAELTRRHSCPACGGPVCRRIADLGAPPESWHCCYCCWRDCDPTPPLTD